jgi:hypothetical protein
MNYELPCLADKRVTSIEYALIWSDINLCRTVDDKPLISVHFKGSLSFGPLRSSYLVSCFSVEKLYVHVCFRAEFGIYKFGSLHQNLLIVTKLRSTRLARRWD